MSINLKYTHDVDFQKIIDTDVKHWEQQTSLCEVCNRHHALIKRFQSSNLILKKAVLLHSTSCFKVGITQEFVN